MEHNYNKLAFEHQQTKLLELQEDIKKFHRSIKYGCIFVCSACHQTNFEDNVTDITKLQTVKNRTLLKQCLTSYKSVNNKECICLPCKRAIY